MHAKPAGCFSLPGLTFPCPTAQGLVTLSQMQSYSHSFGGGPF